MSLSLSPRFNLFNFMFPFEIIPTEINEKWLIQLNKLDKNIIYKPIDIINESIQSVNIPGLVDNGTEQSQIGRNDTTGMIEPSHQNIFVSSTSPLAQTDLKFDVTLRYTKDLNNYFLLYESWFYHRVKNNEIKMPPFNVYITNELGENVAIVKLLYPIYLGIDGISLSFTESLRTRDSFTVQFACSNIDFEILTNESIIPEAEL